MMRSLMAVTCLGLLAGVAGTASAYEPLVDANVPFQFTAGEATLPAGHYQVGVPDETANVLEVKNLDTGKAVLVPYLTRLAARSREESVLVFDEKGNETSLSEVHAPPADGFYVQGVKGPHTHKTVKGAKAAAKAKK